MAKWLSPPPSTCDLCKHPLAHTFIDGKTTWGPWAIMCPKCHGTFGCGFGTGQGQEYDLQTLEKTRG